MKTDHLLHFTPGAEGYGVWRLECIQDTGYHHSSWEEDLEHRSPCRCLAVDDNDCTDCRDDDHGACGFYGGYIYDLGFMCQCVERPGTCWAVEWLNEVGQEWIADGDWTEDGPWFVHADPEDGLQPVDMAAERQKYIDRIAAMMQPVLNESEAE